MMDVRKRIDELVSIPIGMTTREQMLTLAREVKEAATNATDKEFNSNGARRARQAIEAEIKLE